MGWWERQRKRKLNDRKKETCRPMKEEWKSAKKGGKVQRLYK